MSITRESNNKHKTSHLYYIEKNIGHHKKRQKHDYKTNDARKKLMMENRKRKRKKKRSKKLKKYKKIIRKETNEI